MAFQFRTQYGWDSQPTEPSVTTPPGFYPAKIVAAEEKLSKSGKQMLQLKLEVDAGGSRTVDINEYLLLEPNAAWKMEQYMAACGFQFGANQDIVISAPDFLGKTLYVLTYNEPGVKNADRLYMKILRSFRVQDVKAPGPLPKAQLEDWGLNPDGTRKGSREEMRANAQPWQHPVPPQQNGWGQQPQQAAATSWAQSGSSNFITPKQNYGYQNGQGAPVPLPNEEADDIPF